MRKITFFLCAVLLTMVGFAQGSETFENADLPGEYSDGTFVGESGLTFTYGESRDQADYPIEAEGLLLRRASDSYLEWTVPDGVGEVSFEYRKAYTGGAVRQLELIVNDVQVATTPEFGEGSGEQDAVYTFSQPINQNGEVTIKIKNVGTTTGNRHSVIDNISWTATPGDGSEFPNPYCAIVDADEVTVEEITKVVFADTSIINDDTETVLIDKTDSLVNLMRGETYTISVEGNTKSNEFDFDNDIVAFIDWNQNGILDDEGEVYEIGTITGSDGNDGVAVTIDITVPMDAVEGLTRIRITKTYGDAESPAVINPCGIEMNAFQFIIVPGYGQALDFTLQIEEADDTDFPCTFAHEVEGNATGGSGSSVNSDYKSAVDIIVVAGQDFTLNTIEVPFLTFAPEDPPILAEVVYYEDNEGFPGTEIGSETVVPTILNSGLWVNPDAYEFETQLEMTPFTFAGSYDVNTTYWIEISMGTATNQETVFWAYSDNEGIEGAPMVQYNGLVGTWSIPEAVREGIYNFSGVCNLMESLGDCTGTPEGGIATVSPASGNVGVEYIVSASGFTAGYSGTTYQWQSNTDGNGWVDEGDVASHYSAFIATAPGEIGMEVEWRLAVTCTLSEEIAYSQTATFMSVMSYCTPVYSTGCDVDDTITNVTLIGESQSINNDSGCSENGYGDYTDLTPADLVPGNTYTLSITTDYSSPTSEQVRAWIDYNQDGVFSEMEEIANSAGNGLPGGTGTFEFTVPETASPGNYRMRVRMGYGTAAPTYDACDSLSWGEAEDYTVEVIALDECSEAIAGTPEETTMEVCANTTFTIRVTGSSEPADGLHRTWQSSPAGANDWTAMSGATSEVLTVLDGVVEATDYRYVVTCSITEESDASDIIQISINQNAAECYCTPEGINDGRYINNFSTTGGTQNITNLNSGFSEGGYGDFTDLILEAAPGYEVNFEVDIVGGTAGFRIWVDWNNDGTFDPVEEVVYNSGGYENSHSGIITVPENATPGTTRMRIVSHWLSTTGNVNPCETGFNFGEFEDYTFIIAESADCEGTPAAGVATVDPESGLANSNYTVSATGYSIGNGLTYQWQSNTDQEEWVDEGNAEDSYEPFNATAPAESDNTVEWRLKVTCTFSGETSYSEVATFTTTDTLIYCTPMLDCTDGDVITNVTFQEINNTTVCSPDGYGDYTNMVAAVEAGNEYPISVTVGDGWSNESVSVWIDFNNNGEFEEDEFFYIGTGSDEVLTGNISIPTTLADGNYRMRVRVSAVGESTATWDMACDESQGYGETEDYTITVGEVLDGYCTPMLDCTEGDVITNVTFQEIDNTTVCSPDGYGDYTNMIATVGPGLTYPISVTVGDGYGFESISVWIDFNDNGIFDEEEFFYIGTGNNQTLTGNIAIPTNATDGNYRMRVRLAAVGEEFATWDMACDESQNFGETEDYTVVVDETLSIDNHTISDFMYYPNPMTDVLFISTNENIETFSVYNLLGQQVLSNKHFNNGKVDATSLPTGTYIFRVTFDNGHIKNFKVVKK